MTDSAAATIVVEGKDDRRFVRQYLQYLGFGGLLFDGEPKSPDAAGKIIIRETNGIGALTGRKISPDVIQDTGNSDKVLIVADANADVQKRHKQLRAAAEKIKAETDADAQLFLLPDDKTAGALENLLIIIFRGGDVAECFGRYKECLRDKNLQPPGAKGEIYAYCEAHKAETGASRREYLDSNLWNLDHPALQPLRDFLLKNLSSPDEKPA